MNARGVPGAFRVGVAESVQTHDAPSSDDRSDSLAVRRERRLWRKSIHNRSLPTILFQTCNALVRLSLGSPGRMECSCC